MAKHINIKNKKKFIGLIIAIVAVIAVVAIVIGIVAGKKKDKEEEADQKPHEQLVTECIDELEEMWTANYDRIGELYDSGTFRSEGKEDRILEIKNVRVITTDGKEDKEYSKLRYIVEFELYSNRYRTAPYLIREDIFCCVAVYENGDKVVMSTNILDDILSQGEPDSDRVLSIVSKVEDLGDIYNQKIDLD